VSCQHAPLFWPPPLAVGSSAHRLPSPMCISWSTTVPRRCFSSRRCRLHDVVASPRRRCAGVLPSQHRPLSPCKSGPSCCRAGALRVKQAAGGHLATGRAASARRRPCRKSRHVRALSIGVAHRARPWLRVRRAVGRPSAVWAARRPGRARQAVLLCSWVAHAGFSPLA
jgi:hypothetical protein